MESLYSSTVPRSGPSQRAKAIVCDRLTVIQCRGVDWRIRWAVLGRDGEVVTWNYAAGQIVSAVKSTRAESEFPSLRMRPN